MTQRKVLISGAGIAGASLAHWLTRDGFDVAVVERAAKQRSSGNPVDVVGDALPVVGAMGVLDSLHAAATTARRTVIVDGGGHPVVQLATQNSAGRQGAPPAIEIPRADLASILLDAASRSAEVRQGEMIASLEQDAGGVDVRLSSGEERRVDLVVGADGVHSHTRQLVFDPDSVTRRHLGMYVATVRAPGLQVDAEEVQLYNAPGRMVSIHPGRAVPLVAFMFRGGPIRGYDPRDMESHRRLVIDSFRGLGWRVPELLDHVQASSDVFFDSVARVRVPRWSTGRVGLIGDAASCVSLLGNGSTNAIVGARALATALAETPDHDAAFRRFQGEHSRRLVSTPRVLAGTRLLVPGTRAGISARNGTVRWLRRFRPTPLVGEF